MKKIIERALMVIEEELIPETKKGVAKGNKVFGGAILTKSNYSTVTIGVNPRNRKPALSWGNIYVKQILCRKQKQVY